MTKWYQEHQKVVPHLKRQRIDYRKKKNKGETMQHQPKQQQIQIKIDEKVGEGVYSNFFMISNNPSEYIIDCGRTVPGMPDIKILSRIITTPQHAKQLLQILQQNIEQFEKQFGEIKLPQMPVMENKNIGFQSAE